MERRAHDMGGLPAGPIEIEEHPAAPWQKATVAMRGALGEKGLVRVDELRRAIEDLPAADYENLAYFEKWITALTNLLVEKGLLTPDEVEARIAELRARRTAQLREKES